MSNLAIITARGKSKRIPRKNIKEFCGIPIIAYSIKAAIDSNIFDEIMVSTDDEEIGEISKHYGANVPFFRSALNSNDTATTADVLLEVLNNYKEKETFFDNFCCIYPTAPLLSKEILRDAFDKFNQTKADSLIPVAPFSYPWQRAFKISNNHLEYIYPEFTNTRSQDLEIMYHDIGQFYFSKTDVFLKYKKFNNPTPYELSELYVQDIDNKNDWEIAEFKYAFLKNKNEKTRP